MVSRRTFLRRSSAVAAGLGFAGLALPGCGPQKGGSISLIPFRERPSNLSYHPQMGYRRLGKTELMVSEIVLSGGFDDGRDRLFRAISTDEEIPSHILKNRTDVISKCIECGINYLDVTCAIDARAYGVALKGRRERMYVAADDKTYCMRHTQYRNVKSQMRNIESCLAGLGTDYLDIWRPQYKEMGGHRDVEVETCIATFEKARRQGKVRFLGLDTRDRSWILHLLEHFSQHAVIYTPYVLYPAAKPANLSSIDRTQLYEPSSWGGKRRDTADELLTLAEAQATGVIATGPFDPGAVSDDPKPEGESLPQDPESVQLLLACTLSNPRLSAVAIEMASPEAVERYAEVSYGRRQEA